MKFENAEDCGGCGNDTRHTRKKERIAHRKADSNLLHNMVLLLIGRFIVLNNTGHAAAVQ